MACEETIPNIYGGHGQYTGYEQDDDLDYEPHAATSPSLYFSGNADGASFYSTRQRKSRLSLKSEGDDVEPSSEDEESKGAAKGGGGGGGALLDVSDKDEESPGRGVASMPGTPERGPAVEGKPEWLKEYASETETRGGRRRRHHHRRGRRTRERWLERAWQMKKSHAAAEDAAEECRVVVRPRWGSGRMCMDMEEVRACRDLGLSLPSDWMVEIPETFSDLTADTSSGGNSPINWRISSPGDDPKDVKARLKVWAQAVALTSASRLSG